MPILRRVDPATQVLQTTITGRVTLDELREHFAAVRQMNWQRLPELIDTRTATIVGFSARDLPRLSELGRQLFAEGPIAPRAVIVSGVVYFGVARLFAAVSEGWVRISVFDELASAEAWLLQFVSGGF